MVKGFQRKRLAVVDLDGTLVRGNTLHEYIRIGFRRVSWRGRFKIINLALLRAFHLIPHARFKFGCLKLIAPTPALLKEFAERIESIKNPAILSLIASMEAEGTDILLATAAADTYVGSLWSGEYIATTTAEETELKGERKLQAVERYMEEHNLALYAVITDHHDDLPLMLAGARRNILVHPSEKTLTIAKKNGVANLEVV